MAQIEGIRIRNYQVLKDVTLGKIMNSDNDPLEKMTVVIGKNGVGKSTLFDVFGFLSDSLRYGVDYACENNRRGGFENIRSQGANQEPISFDIYYRESEKKRPISYNISINIDKHKKPFVELEKLLHRRSGQPTGRPYKFLDLHNGKGRCWSGNLMGITDDEHPNNPTNSTEDPKSTNITLDDKSKLGISIISSLSGHPRITNLRNFIGDWYLSYFSPDYARILPYSGSNTRLNTNGDNIANFLQYLEREDKKKGNPHPQPPT